MKIEDFRKRISLDSTIIVDGKKLEVKEIVKFRVDDGSFYFKCFLSDGYVLADDNESNCYILVQQVDCKINPPFPKTLPFKDKMFKFLYEAHAVAEETFGESIFPKGNSEKFWDYKASDDSYLSLGIDDQTGKRADFYGKIVKLDDLKLA